jgi:beta-lactamase regulating signal transducer with metallopeptidase domain
MISAWMAYAVAISCLLGIAALAVERACRLRRWPTRWIWMLVLIAPFVLPFAARVADESPDRVQPTAPAATPAPGVVAREATLPTPAAAVKRRMSRFETSPGVASLLGSLWICASAALALGLASNWLRMRRKSRSWTHRTLDGTTVLVSDDIGPAVIGFRRPEIVLPEWLLSADRQVVHLAIAHETQHVLARDPLLLLAGTVAVVLLPWNLLLWWQWRRLRLAIEVDCDARVLSAGGIAGVDYAKALLNVAERSSGVPLAAAAMCESQSTLEKRIQLLLLERTASQRVLVLALVVGGIGVAAAATQIQAPAAFDDNVHKKLVDRALGRELVQAISEGDRDHAVALINAGADVDRVVLGDGTPLIVAARSGDMPLVNLLLERGAQADLPVPGDGSPLIAASMLGNLDIVRTLVASGADVNGFVPGDETPLINAARAGNLDVVQYLISNGADVNLAVPADPGIGAEIRSPLGEALEHERTSVASYLRTQGARR